MGDTTDELLALAAAITDEPDPRELDMLLATGEHQSATLMSMALHALGVPAISLTGAQAGITTDGRYGRARIAGIDPRPGPRRDRRGQGRHRRRLPGPERAAALELAETTTLGRGGSRHHRRRPGRRPAAPTAARSSRTSSGIYTADPRLVPDARQLAVIGYEEMLELAHQGAQVMQVRAVELGWVNDVVIEVLSSFEDAPGTLIKEDPLVEQRNKVRGPRPRPERGQGHPRRGARIGPGVAHAIFAPLAEAGINVDMIVQNVGHGGTTDMSFTVPRVELGEGQARPGAGRPRAGLPRDDHGRLDRQGLHRRAPASTTPPATPPGCSGRSADAGVNIEMISTSEVRITCMIAEDDLETAVRALHAAFELERPPTRSTPRARSPG